MKNALFKEVKKKENIYRHCVHVKKATEYADNNDKVN